MLQWEAIIIEYKAVKVCKMRAPFDNQVYLPKEEQIILCISKYRLDFKWHFFKFIALIQESTYLKTFNKSIRYLNIRFSSSLEIQLHNTKYNNVTYEIEIKCTAMLPFCFHSMKL